MLAGKPRHGPVFDWMVKTRSQFKLALRCCHQHEDTLRSDYAATSLASKDYNKFWSCIRKTNNSKASVYATCMDGCTNNSDIVERWHGHFEQLYNSNHLMWTLWQRSCFFEHLGQARPDEFVSQYVTCYISIISKNVKLRVQMVFIWKPSYMVVTNFVYICVSCLICSSSLVLCRSHL